MNVIPMCILIMLPHLKMVEAHTHCVNVSSIYASTECA